MRNIEEALLKGWDLLKSLDKDGWSNGEKQHVICCMQTINTCELSQEYPLKKGVK